jgi:predicted transcriptional regulator
LEQEIFQILTLLNTRCPNANVADIFERLVSISFNGTPAVAERAKQLLRERFNTQVESVCSF